MSEKDMSQQQPLVCNQCATHLEPNIMGYLPDHLHINKRWGFGTPLDNLAHSFVLCQGCYLALIEGFQIPPTLDSEPL